MPGSVRDEHPGHASRTTVVERFVKYVHRVLPQGGSLPDDIWRQRHRGILLLLWLHALGIVAFAMIRGNGLTHSLLEGSVVVAAAALAGLKKGNRKFHAAMASLGLLSSSALLVHLSGGYIEFHFHFFVMIGVMALYEDWVPFLLAIAYVVVHHGTVGVLYPSSVYNHPDAWAHPWKWAAIHGAFVMGASIASLIAWRMNEAVRARSNLILHSAGEGIYGVDVQGHMVFANPAAARMIGREAEELIGKDGHELLHHSRPDGAPYPREACPIYAAFRDGTVRHEADEVFWRKDGTSFPVEYISTPILERGHLVGAVVTFRDITERKQAEEEIRRTNAELERRVGERTAQLTERGHELREAKALLEHLVAASPAVIYQSNVSDFTITYISPNVERLLGYAPEDVLGASRFWSQHSHPEDRELFVAELLQAMDEKATLLERESRFQHTDGRYLWLQSTICIEYDAGNPVRILGHVLDISKRRAAEEAVKQAKEEAERANRAKSEFLSRMSHELRTPLNAILGFAQLLEMDSPSPEQRESVQHILKGGRHLLELINEVLDIARIETGRLALSPEPVSVRDVIQESFELIAPLAVQQAISLNGPAAQTLEANVLADRQRLKQVLLNLLSNAVKYNRHGGMVTLSCEDTAGGRLRIKVKDTGPGIPRDKMPRLFIPFERLGAERTAVDGAGVGLALSKRLVEAMGGDIGVESEVGQGSTFWVEFPRVESPLERVERIRENVPASAGGAPASGSAGPRTVLYIEDNLANVDLLQRLLAQYPGVKLLSAMQGRLGLDLARQHRPDLILLDLHLPDIPGEEILRRLQANPQTRSIPVAVISADPGLGQGDRFLAVGAHACLTKPLDVKKLQTLLNETLKDRAATTL
ncbi:MAG: PAS domain-containing hybrid sensor histidine kinase/response regulator [bacterium]